MVLCSTVNGRTSDMAYLPKLNPTVGGGLGGLPTRAAGGDSDGGSGRLPIKVTSTSEIKSFNFVAQTGAQTVDYGASSDDVSLRITVAYTASHDSSTDHIMGNGLIKPKGSGSISVPSHKSNYTNTSPFHCNATLNSTSIYISTSLYGGTNRYVYGSVLIEELNNTVDHTYYGVTLGTTPVSISDNVGDYDYIECYLSNNNQAVFTIINGEDRNAPFSSSGAVIIKDGYMYTTTSTASIKMYAYKIVR
jgi:hypothetical protein